LFGLLKYSSYSVFLSKHSPFSFPLFSSNIPDSLHRTGSCLVPGCQSRSTVTGTLIKNVTDGTRRKKMKGIFEKLPGQTSFHQQMFVATGNSKARIFQSSLET
jgi:hypothetical protein